MLIRFQYLFAALGPYGYALTYLNVIQQTLAKVIRWRIKVMDNKSKHGRIYGVYAIVFVM